MPVKIVALITAQPGHENEVEALLHTLVAGSRTEPGNLRYDLWRDASNEARFVVDELYTDHAATDAHRAAPHYVNFRASVMALLAGPPVVVQCDEVDIVA